MDTIDLQIQGMTCGSCVNAVTRTLQRVPGVQQVDVDLARGTARVSGEAGATPAMIAALQQAGYEAVPASPGSEAAKASAHSGGCGSGRGGCCCN